MNLYWVNRTKRQLFMLWTNNFKLHNNHVVFQNKQKSQNQSTSWIIFAKRKYLWQKIEYHESFANTISHFLSIVFSNILRKHNIVLGLNKTYIIASLDSVLILIIFSVVLDRFSTKPQSNLARWNVRFLRRSIYVVCNW